MIGIYPNFNNALKSNTVETERIDQMNEKLS